MTTDAAEGALLALRQGYEDPDSIAGAKTILAGTNALRTSLSASAYPALMNAFRIGFVVGFAGETLIVVARSNPSDEMSAKYVPLMKQYKSTLVDDLARADLPQDLIDAVGRIDQDARSVKQLQSVINACLTAKDLVEKLPHGQPPKATKRDDRARPAHKHPKGFTFEYPVGWTLEDDTTNKTTLLLPPGSDRSES